MRIRESLSREHVGNALKSLGKLRIKVSHGSIAALSALIVILVVAFTIRVFPIRWEIQSGEMHLSEFDPYYQYSLTRYMVNNGLISPYWPTQWVDKQRWYPDGINMASSYPALPMTAAVLYEAISALGINMSLMDFCALFPAIMGALACLIIYFLGKDVGGTSIGLLAALFLALSPSFIQRTSLGFFDDETIGIVALLLFSLLFLRAIETERPVSSTVTYSLGSAAALAYFISGWGAAYYPIGLTVLFVFVLILLKRYTSRLLLSYSITFGLGLFIAINVPYISTGYLTASVILPVAGVFALLCVSELLRVIKLTRSKVIFVALILVAFVGGFFALWQLGYMRSIAGKFISVLDPFARAASPLVESVAEHRISSWSSIYYDLGIGIVFFIVGFFFLLKNLNNRNLFLLLFGLTSLYFASSMVRLLVLMAPALAIIASMGIMGVLKPFITLLREPPKIVTKKKLGLEHVGKEFSGTAVFLIFIILMTNFAFSPQSNGVPKVYNQAYVPVTITSASLPIAPSQPVNEWFDMLRYLNNFQDSKIVVCAWWDYGYWLSILGNVTSLADNATINGTQIENVGFVFMASEVPAVEMLRRYNVKYVLVFTTLSLGTSGNQYVASWAGYGDEGKWMWMARISGKAKDRFIGEGLLTNSSAWADETTFGSYQNSTWTWNDVGRNSTIYKLMSTAKQEWCTKNNVANQDTAVEPEYFKEAYIAGMDLPLGDAGKYGGIIPLVCLYEVEYPSS
jgi:dolichyl-diphosphooligosaccharide--protein glycosyltransferase